MGLKNVQQAGDPNQQVSHLAQFGIIDFFNGFLGQNGSNQDGSHPGSDHWQVGSGEDTVIQAKQGVPEDVEDGKGLHRSQVFFFVFGQVQKVDHHQRAADAKQTITKTGSDNVKSRHGSGHFFWAGVLVEEQVVEGKQDQKAAENPDQNLLVDAS